MQRVCVYRIVHRVLFIHPGNAMLANLDNRKSYSEKLQDISMIVGVLG